MGTKCEDGMHVRVHLGKYGKTFFKKAELDRGGSIMKRVCVRCHREREREIILMQTSR